MWKRVWLLLLVATTTTWAESLRPPGSGLRHVASGRWRPQLATWEDPVSGFPPYGEPSGTDLFPTYAERLTLVWYNKVRIDPLLYRNNWIRTNMISGDSSWQNVFASSDYPAQPPLKWNLNLARVSRAHSTDRQTCAPGAGGSGTQSCPGEPPHMDCNGTTFCTRITSYYTPTSEYGEIFWDFPGWQLDGTFETGQIQQLWPYYAVGGWICDGPMFSNGQFSECPADGSGSDGHRNNIMTLPQSVHGEVGCGQVYLAQDADYYNEPRVISTCDMSGSGPSDYGSLTIFGGAHVLMPNNNAVYAFWANFYSEALDVVQALVVVDGVAEVLAVESGTPAARTNPGTYGSTPRSYTLSEACHTYYFEFRLSDGSIEVYPFVGAFQTQSIGACSTDWISSGGGNATRGNSTQPVSSWSTFTPCSVSCGGGTQVRQCILGVSTGTSCLVGASQQACNTQPCGVATASALRPLLGWQSWTVYMALAIIALKNYIV